MRGYDRARFVEQCRSKVWYETEEAAVSAARRVGEVDGPRLMPYRCVICRLWHLTSKLPDELKRESLERLEEEFQKTVGPSARGKRLEDVT